MLPRFFPDSEGMTHAYRVDTYTARRAVLVVSRDGFILWSRASESALKTGVFFRTSGAPVEIPARSLAATQDQLVDGRTGILHGPISGSVKRYGK
jgi:hypothetical protein